MLCPLWQYLYKSLYSLEKMKLLSVVVPLYNEDEVLNEFYRRISPCLKYLGIPFEIILVDDGSTDFSLQIAQNLREFDQSVKIISFSRNFGQQSAITAGLYYTKGDAVIVMDADLQDPPELISKLVEKFQEGYDIIYAIRQSRKENILKRGISKIFYCLMRFIAVVRLPVDTGDFCIMSRRAVNLLNSLPEKNRYNRGLRAWLGLPQIGIPYERKERFKGKTKYTPWKMLRVALDAIVSFSRLPFQILFILGAALMILPILICLGLILTGAAKTLLPWIIAGLLFVIGMQFLVLGLIGEILWHISDEVKCRPGYIIKEKYGFDQD